MTCKDQPHHPSDESALDEHKRATTLMAFGEDVELDKDGEVSEADARDAHR